MGRHGEDIGKTWGRHGQDMGIHGEDMGKTWGRHGEDMGRHGKTRGRHGKSFIIFFFFGVHVS
jgi:hypothetical protein